MQYQQCGTCAGSGRLNCTGCAGFGFHTVSTTRTRWDGSIEYVPEQRPCSSCGGTGKTTCPSCGGRGSILNSFKSQTWSHPQKNSDGRGETPSTARTNQPDPPDAEPFVIQEYQAYYHPRHPAFFVQYLGGIVFFTHIPGANVNESVRIDDIATDRWCTFTSSGKVTIPVTLWREGSTLRGRWL